MDRRIQTVLEGAVRLLREELSAGLTGIYAHGSLAMGCFNSMLSDIDLLVVVREPRARHTYRRIADKLIRLEEEQPIGAGIELSVVLETYAKAFVHPTPFEFHYSAHHRCRYEEEADYVCGGTEDPDLAAHFAVTYGRGFALWGQPIREVFQPIDGRYFRESVLSDVREATAGIARNPVYYVLNLCRTLQYVRESAISSKREGGEWAAFRVPRNYRDLIAGSLAVYRGERRETAIDEELLLSFAAYMLREIGRHTTMNDEELSE